MITRELAEQILKELTASMYEYCLNEKKVSSDEATRLSMRLYNHCFVVGIVAEKIGIKAGLDGDRCYILGLLHDLGKFTPNRSHGIVGYEIANSNNDFQLAKICLTHVFAQDKKIRDSEFPNNNFRDQDIEKTKKILADLEFDDYDLLIRLSDFMSIGESSNASTIDDRLVDLKNRYGMTECEHIALKEELSGIKSYFDKKLCCDLYKMFNLCQSNEVTK